MPGRRKRFASSPNRENRPNSLGDLLSSFSTDALSTRVKELEREACSTHLHLLASLRMSGAIIHFQIMPSWIAHGLIPLYFILNGL